MHNSNAYCNFLDQLKATGTKKLDGYYQDLLEEIYEWEREEVEDIIWNIFCKEKDTNLAIFLPKLKKYDGVDKLKEVLHQYKIPSSASVNISQVLYNITFEEKYLDVIKQNIDKDTNNISYVSALAYCKPSIKGYNLLCDIYVTSDNQTNRSTAITGILYNKGIVKNPCDMQELISTLELRKKFIANDSARRKEILKAFEKGVL